MEINKERKIAMTEMHDQFVHAYNEFLKDVSLILGDPDDLSRGDLELAAEVRLRSKIIAAQIAMMDAALDKLGFYHQTLRANSAVQKEAAEEGTIWKRN